MTLLSPLGLLAALAVIPIVALHMLTPRRPREPVSSLLLWRGLEHPVTATDPWQRLRFSLLLILQLLAAVLLAVALATPAVVETTALAEHTVFIVDASGSMAAIDGSPDRLGAAVDRTTELLGQIPEGGTASLVVASPRPVALVEDTADTADVERALRGIRTVPGAADFEEAFAIAESLASPERPTGYVLLSDGGLEATEQRAAPPGVRYEPLGDAATNRAITDLAVSTSPGGLLARVTVENTGGADATQKLRLDVDGVTAERRDIDIPAGAVVEETFELPLGGRVSAFLEGEDLLATDDQRYVTAAVAETLKVRVIGESTFFIDQLLASLPGIAEPGFGEDVDLEIYAGAVVPADPVAPFIAIDTPGGAPGIIAAGRVESPVPTFVADDPLLDEVDVSNVAIADAQLVEPGSATVLLGAPGAPLILRSEANGVPFYYLTFTLERSNLPVDLAFPVLGSRMVNDLTAVVTTSAMTVGQPLPVGTEGAVVVDPRGNRRSVGAGDVAPLADLTGFWTITPNGTPNGTRNGAPEAEGEIVVAANTDIAESRLAVANSLPELRLAPPTAEAPSLAERARSIVPWVIAAIVLVLAIELAVSRREIGVGRTQWRAGLGLRVVIVALLVLAAVNPTFSRSSDQVTTVFVLDGSESVGGSGDTEALRWVKAALADRGGAAAGVVEVAGSARIGLPIGASGPIVDAGDVGTGATNLTRGLRLARSMLPGETRERIVLISDGRPTSGDLETELERLAALGIAVDVHTVASVSGPDAAVASVEGPASVAVGEAYAITTEIVATQTATATVELLNDGEVVATQDVALAEGRTEVTFDVVADVAGIERYEIRTNMGGDVQPANDSSEVAVDVRGPATVLVVEGVAGNAASISAALVARGLEIETVAAADMPALEGLAAHQAVVLVDVREEQIAGPPTEALDAFVRNLGRGLVVVGGDQSYGLGGYADSGLEALLPVESEVEDLQREATVAEVLLIDTSESMGACHCAPVEGVDDPFAGEPVEGGVNKTDISRSGAARAIQSLGADDEVGVLAFNASQNWVIPLQQLPAQQVIDEGLGSLRPFGETRLSPALEEAAEALRASSKELRHIILFTDGFTPELFNEGFDPETGEFIGLETNSMAEQAAELAAEGITVSVVATGEGASQFLEAIAEAGNGRFYPGRDLDEIPEIFVKEARLAARSFLNEGEFFPSVRSSAAAVRNLASSPSLLGFVATKPKATAQVQLDIGEFADPLLTTWRVGLGEVTAWTSDGGERWAANWAAWDGFADFWSTVVRDSFPLSGASGLRLDATVRDGVLNVSLESADPLPAGEPPVAFVGLPDGTSQEVRLDRRSDTEFGTEIDAPVAGAYSVGVGVGAEEGTVTLSALAARSFSAEYLPGPADSDLMLRISSTTSGRGEITPDQAFDVEGLQPGLRSSTFRWWFLLAAALLWPIDVAIRRLRIRRRGDLRAPPSRRQATPATPVAG